MDFIKPPADDRVGSRGESHRQGREGVGVGVWVRDHAGLKWVSATTRRGPEVDADLAEVRHRSSLTAAESIEQKVGEGLQEDGGVVFWFDL